VRHLPATRLLHNLHTMKKLLSAAGLVWCVRLAAPQAAPFDWPQFRGPHGAGVADDAALPERWSATENIAWAAKVPGRGWSSPILWGDRIYLTTAISPGRFKAPSTGIFGNDYAAELEKQGLSEDEVLKRVVNRDIELTTETGEIRYVVLALRKSDGNVLWQREAHRGLPPGGRHRKNTYASETPATDGERLYASFGGNVGVFCYSLDGKPLWQHTWPPQPIYLDFGTASSPIVHQGRVYQLHDNDGESFLAALDAKTGKELWTVKRKDLASRLASGWATPFVWESGARTEIVTIGRGFVISYDTGGRELWRLKGMTQATPSPVAADGLLYVGSGSQGEANRPLLAIRPGANGDITPDETGKSAYVAWTLPRFSGYTTSPLVYRGRVYAINDNGVLQVADARTGAEIYKARVGGGGRTFSSSPLASDGRIYCISEDGEAIVFRAGDSYDEIARNHLEEMSLASPAADSDALYVRTQTKLYRIRAVGPKG
jgi:outer membrane protein assembly factor BamB